MVDTTLIYIFKGNQVLMAMKKRGYGVGKLCGPGGKLQDGETPLQAAIRETEEEIGCYTTAPTAMHRQRCQ